MSQPDLDALLVANIGDLNAAASHLEHVLQVEVAAAIDDLINNLRSNLRWDGEEDWSGDCSIWVAPKDWLKADAGPGDDYNCQFSFEVDDEKKEASDPFWLAQIVGCGQAQLGFRWSRNNVPPKRWGKLVGQKTDLIAKLRGLGFSYREADGSFFLFVKVGQTELANAMSEESAVQALRPIRDAFDRLVDAKPVFDELIAAIDID